MGRGLSIWRVMSATRGDILRKVLSLRVIAADERCPEGERDTARILTERLIEKWGLTEAELVEVRQVDESNMWSFLNEDARAWNQEIEKDVNGIRDAIEALVVKISRQQSAATRARALDRLWRRLRDKTEGTPYVPGVKSHRDHALFHVYEESVARCDPDLSPRMWALWDVRTAGDLRSERDAEAAIRRGVIVHRVKVERETALKPCVVCGGQEDVRFGHWNNADVCEAVHARCHSVWRERNPGMRMGTGVL